MDLLNYIDRGGIIVYILIALNIIGFSIIIWKFFTLLIFKGEHRNIVKNILLDLKRFDQPNQNIFIQNAVNSGVKKLETGLNTIKTIAIISPLLGLLGTVIGILNTFDKISISGLNDPTLFSAGISIALITTIAGLIVAIPHYIGYNYFLGVLDNLELKIENQVLKNI